MLRATSPRPLFRSNTGAVFGTCYTLYSCHAIDSQLTVTSQSSTSPENSQAKRALRVDCRLTVF